MQKLNSDIASKQMQTQLWEQMSSPPASLSSEHSEILSKLITDSIRLSGIEFANFGDSSSAASSADSTDSKTRIETARDELNARIRQNVSIFFTQRKNPATQHTVCRTHT